MNTSVKICPREQCFMWREKGDLCTSGVHDSLDVALKMAAEVDEGNCGVPDSFGITCIRDCRGGGLKDYFEPIDSVFMGWTADFVNDPNNDYEIVIELWYNRVNVALISKNDNRVELKWYANKNDLIIHVDWLNGLLIEAKTL